MSLDLKSNNNLPQSSTSSCTDYFFDGCHSKSQNCQTQYQNCQCRPCCINSMINDHTYSLLKKICRKAIKDYHRQQCREQYTIFDGGNSVNAQIYRSTFVGKCRPENNDPSISRGEGFIVEDRRKNESKSDRSAKNRSKKKGSFSEADKDASAKATSGREKSRKSYPNDYEAFSERRSKKIKRRGSETNDAVADNGTRSKAVKGKDKLDTDQYYNEKQGKVRKVKAKGEDEEDGASGYRENSKNKKKKDGNVISGKEKRDKDKSRKGTSHNGDDEDDDIKAPRKRGKYRRKKSLDNNDSRDHSSGEGKSVDKKKGGGGDVDRVNDDSLAANLGKNIRRRESVDSNHKEGDSIEDRASKVYAKDKAGNKDSSRKGDAMSNQNKGYRADIDDRKKIDSHDGEGKGSRDPNHKIDGIDRGRSGHKGYRSREGHIDDRKSTYLKNNGTSDLPVISDLRAKVRKGHDVMTNRKSRTGIDGNRSRSFEGEGRITRGIHGATIQLHKGRLKHISKSSKDRINERHGSRSSRRKSRSSRRPGCYRRYEAWLPSRCDEIRPCDILRAHMEQRELWERQSCLTCPCDCSAIYCQAPSTLCSCQQ